MIKRWQSLLAVVLMFFIYSHSFGQNAQLSFGRFVNSPEDSFEWFAGIEADTTISPGGTEVGFGGRAVFSSYKEFLDDIVGEWTVADFFSNEGHFTLASVDESLFPEATLLFPLDGDTLLSGIPFEPVSYTHLTLPTICSV